MGGAAFRMFFGARAASAEELARVEEVTVEQEIDMAWEGRVRMSMCLGDDGRWADPPSSLTAPFGRMRIELKLGSGDFVPLIDGPVAAFDTALGANPGTSTVSLVIRDDSVLMNREEETEIFEDREHSNIAEEIFTRFTSVADTRVSATGEQEAVTVRRGTPIQFLREMARVHNFKAYVLPGEAAGTSTGVFEALRTEPSGLPPLVLMGPNRSLQSVSFREESNSAERSRGRSLSISDQQIVPAEHSFQDQNLMGGLPALSDDPGALRELPPEENTGDTPDAATAGQANRASYGHSMSAELMPGCYDTVLRPYEVIQVQAGDIPESGDWLLHKVTHRFNASVYRQEIEAKRNSRSAIGGGPTLPGIF